MASTQLKSSGGDVLSRIDSVAVVTGAGRTAGMQSCSGHSYNKHTHIHTNRSVDLQLTGGIGMRVHHTRAHKQ